MLFTQIEAKRELVNAFHYPTAIGYWKVTTKITTAATTTQLVILVWKIAINFGFYQ